MSENNDPEAQPPAELARPEMRDKPTVVLGGGPAGLTAGYVLAKQGLPVIVLEVEDQVGGIAKTAVRDGYRFDPRPPLLHEGQGDRRPLARDHEGGIPRAAAHVAHLLASAERRGSSSTGPLRGPDVMKKLGPVDLDEGTLSYLWAALKPKGKEDN